MEPRSVMQREAKTIEDAISFKLAGERVVLATVLKTWGSSPRPIGAVMAISESRKFVGSVSGGCIEDELIGLIQNEFPTEAVLIEYSSETTRTLPCGGTLLLLLEPLDSIDALDEMVKQLKNGISIVRSVTLPTLEISWRAATDDDKTGFSSAAYDILYERNWQILIVGMGELSQWVYQVANLMDYEVKVCEPREDYRESWPFGESKICTDYPDDFVRLAKPDRQTCVLALTHDPKIDDMAIMEALITDAFYVGALGSKRTTYNRADRLKTHFGMKDKDIRRLHAPIGLDLNTRKPQEIALSIITEITAVRNRVEIKSSRLE
ncbi:MAG: XdhC family protein [Proteobacteria bacterium]|jgi:xanthine dehydrogenase accessory factor|nr:XdhC family protein [Pseudomonadota bacterium]MBT7561502.1 XdhC family protein [Pseudomonadota bacterium]